MCRVKYFMRTSGVTEVHRLRPGVAAIVEIVHESSAVTAGTCRFAGLGARERADAETYS